MEAVGFIPISVLSDRSLFLPSTTSLKFSASVNFKSSPSLSNSSESLSRNFKGHLVLFSSVLNTGYAAALTYEEALQRLNGTFSSDGTVSFDLNAFLESVANFAVENPAVIAGGVVILAVPLILSQLLGKPKAWGVESAKTAYAKLGDDANTQLLDIRAPVELRQVGSPDIRGLKKKPVSVVYNGEDKLRFLKKLALKFKEPQNTTLLILDKFDGNSELVAELVTLNGGFKAAYAIKDGAEGPRGWMNSGLPWMLPNKTLSFDFSNFTDSLGEGSDAVTVALGVAAAAGLGLLAFSEAETILQILGTAALVQVVSKKLLFAEDRKQTLEQVDDYLNKKIAPKELVDEIKQIGKALLPSPVTSKALPAPAEGRPEVADGIVQKAEGIPEPSQVETAAEPEINSVPKTEVKAESLPGIPRPLSPYPNYPDLRPPASPTPAQP